MTQTRAIIAFAIALLSCAALPAAEIYTNGVGGGPWEEPTTWRGQTVPTADDSVVIRKLDRVTFSGAPSAGITCQSLVLDPDSVLVIRTTTARPEVSLHIGQAIDCYGSLQADLTRDPEATVRLIFAARSSDEPRLILRQRGALLLYGAEDLLGDRRNVTVTSGDEAETSSVIKAEPGAKLDLRWTELQDVALEAQGIDNTGQSARQGLNLAHNRFIGKAYVYLLQCDTAAIDHNRFEGAPGVARAIEIRGCPLASVTGNRIAGAYASQH